MAGAAASAAGSRQQIGCVSFEAHAQRPCCLLSLALAALKGLPIVPGRSPPLPLLRQVLAAPPASISCVAHAGPCAFAAAEQFFDILGEAVPASSNFFINFISFRGIAMAPFRCALPCHAAAAAAAVASAAAIACTVAGV